MNHSKRPHAANQGSALVTVVLLAAIMALLTASMLRYSGSEARGNERNRLILRAKIIAENISIYAAEQLTTKLYNLGTAPVGRFPWTGTSTSRIYAPPDSILLSEFNTSSSGMEMRCAIESVTPFAFVSDPTSLNNGLQVATAKVPIIAKATATHSSIGTMTAYVEQDMQLNLIPLFQFGIFYNMDLEFFPGQDMTIYGPVHTNGRLAARGEQGGAAIVTFSERVTAAKGLYADGQLKASYVKRAGTISSGAGGTGAVYYTPVTGAAVNLMSSGGVWRDHKYGMATETISTQTQFKTFATSFYGGNVRTNAHGSDLQLKLPGIGSYSETDDAATTTVDERNNGRQIIEPRNPKKWNGSSWATYTDDASTAELKLSRKCGLYIIVNPDDEARIGKLPDGTDRPMLPWSYRCWLNTIASDGTQTIREVVLPGQPSYGYSDAGTPGLTSALIADDVRYKNLLPNRYTPYTSVGSNQVLRIAASLKSWDATDTSVNAGSTTLYAVNPGTTTTGYSRLTGNLDVFPDENDATPYPAEAYFFDLRRAAGNAGYTSNIAGGSARGTTNYIPRAIAKIDFDVARFKMMVSRTVSNALTSSGYNVGPPAAANWSSSIYNPAGAMTNLDLGVDANGVAPFAYSVFPGGATPAEMIRLDPFQLYYTPDVPGVIPADPRTLAVPAADLTAAWYDGIAIYVHSVDAEQRADGPDADTYPDRIDSGVRLINGRGPVASLTTTGDTGFTFVTNDAAYIIGHFNADGSVNRTTAATGNGGYSGRYPDSANEKLTAVMADAVTLLSQPIYSTAATPYYQINGWNDALSAFRVTTTGWSTNWRSAAPSGSNNYEGLGNNVPTAIRPGALPTDSSPGATGGTWRTKLPTVDTEFSVALLVGMVPSNHNATGLTDRPPISAANAQYSGGAHNYPRLLEDWHNDMGSGTVSGLFIRGSMVALFESRVAMEPWNIRCYQAPDRFWGLHQDFRTAGHDLPLEPIVLSATRMGFRELTAAEYDARKTSIEALTPIP
jgi:hypothetical protein